MVYSIALRFADNFAPDGGTIGVHRAVLEERGSVWHGKFGTAFSQAKADLVLGQEDPRILLIHSGKSDRWWAHIDAISKIAPDGGYPAYYGGDLSKFHCWFHVTKVEPAERGVMSEWVVPSSGRPLSSASRHSMSPYFFLGKGEPRQKQNTEEH